MHASLYWSGGHVHSMPVNSLLVDATLDIGSMAVCSVVSACRPVVNRSMLLYIGVEDMYIVCLLIAYS